MYHRHVKVIDIFASRIVLEIAGVDQAFVTLGIVFAQRLARQPPEDILRVTFGFFMLAGLALRWHCWLAH